MNTGLGKKKKSLKKLDLAILIAYSIYLKKKIVTIRGKAPSPLVGDPSNIAFWSITLDNLIVFPTRSVRDRAEIEHSMRDHLLKAGASRDETETVIANMREFLELLALDFEFSFSASAASAIEGQLSEFSAALHNRTNQLILERLTMEVKNVASSRSN